MDKLTQILQDNINKSVNDLLTSISRKYDIDELDLKKLWITSQDMTKAPEKKETHTLTSPGEKKTCEYIFKAGKPKGTRCPVSVKEGISFCAKHKEKKKDVVETPPSISALPTIIKHPLLNVLYHKDSNMVFNHERIVIGVIIKNEIKNLEKSDIEICKKWKFKYELQAQKETITPTTKNIQKSASPLPPAITTHSSKDVTPLLREIKEPLAPKKSLTPKKLSFEKKDENIEDKDDSEEEEDEIEGSCDMEKLDEIMSEVLESENED